MNLQTVIEVDVIQMCLILFFSHKVISNSLIHFPILSVFAIPMDTLEIIVGFVPDHSNKVNFAIKPVKWIFWFPSTYKSYLYTVV